METGILRLLQIQIINYLKIQHAEILADIFFSFRPTKHKQISLIFIICSYLCTRLHSVWLICSICISFQKGSKSAEVGPVM